jgi:hypothetical protein
MVYAIAFSHVTDFFFMQCDEASTSRHIVRVFRTSGLPGHSDDGQTSTQTTIPILAG